MFNIEASSAVSTEGFEADPDELEGFLEASRRAESKRH